MTTLRELFPEVERSVRPIILAHSKKISAALGIPMDDAIQEATLALYKALQGYDFNKSHGGIHRFTDVVLRNCAASMIYSATTTARVPHVVYSEAGTLKVMKQRRLVSLDDIEPGTGFQPATDWGDPEVECMRAELENKRAVLRMRLINKLTERELAIFKCLSQPAEAFLIYLRNIGCEGDPTHAAIARYLGIGKNAVDWATLCIRSKFTRLAEEEFPDLVQGHLENGTWPMIHVSRINRPDHEFVANVLRERGLDPRPAEPARDIEISGQWAREVQNYPWGVVLIMKMGDTYRTLVIEGRFNKISGGVSGADGTWKYVTEEVPWYPKLVRELAKNDK
jgi:hypothetical protein